MTRPSHINKSRDHGRAAIQRAHARADWVDRDLPDPVDTQRNATLLRTLDIDPAAMAPGGVAPAMSNDAPRTRQRDRDVTGRPRNTRPRAELGRPLPRHAAGDVEAPAEVALPPHESLAEAHRLLDEGSAFHAHEVLEGTWKAAPESERELWRGLAQLAVGLTHVRRDNPVGAEQLLRCAADRIEGYAHDPPYGIAVTGLVAWTDALIGRIEHEGLAALTPDDLAVPLRVKI